MSVSDREADENSLFTGEMPSLVSIHIMVLELFLAVQSGLSPRDVQRDSLAEQK